MKRFFLTFLCLLILGISMTHVVKSQEQSLQNEAAFVDIEPITFYFHYGSYFSRLELSSSEARIWYSFHAADQNSNEKPLFVFHMVKRERRINQVIFSFRLSLI